MHPRKLFFQPDNSLISRETDAKPYIPKLLDNIKLSQSQYIATSVINYGLYIDNMFALKNFTFPIPFTIPTLADHKITLKIWPCLESYRWITQHGKMIPCIEIKEKFFNYV